MIDSMVKATQHQLFTYIFLTNRISMYVGYLGADLNTKDLLIFKFIDSNGIKNFLK